MQKREFTSFDVATVVHELRRTILDSRISNVYQLDFKTLLFKLHKAGKPAFRLVLEAGKRLHMTSYAMEKPFVPPAFCMALRKYLRNEWLADIEQYEFERVVVFYLRTKTESLQLVLELFGDGNIILVNEKSEILHALTYKRMRDRNILRGDVFRFAPPSGRNPIKISEEEFRVGLRDFGDVEVVRALARFLSIGGLYAEEVLLRANVDKTKHCHALTNSEAYAIFNNLQGLLSQVARGELEPCVILDEDGGFIDVVPFKLRRYDGSPCQPHSSFNEALDEFYVRVVTTEKTAASVKTEELKREAERFKRIIESQEKTLTEARNKAEHNRRIGDAIYAHSIELQVLLDRLLAGRKGGKEWSEIVSEILYEKRAGLKPSVFFESLDEHSLMVNVCVDDLRFDLELHESLYENAERFYELGKRAKQKLEGARVALEETHERLADVEAKISEAEALERVKPTVAAEELVKRKVKHKEWFEKFRWFVSSEGFLVVAGKDAVSNEVLVKKHTEPSEVVFHADVAGAPFVVVKTKEKEPSAQTLHEAAEFAASFSRGWREGFGSVDVSWVKPDQLSKAGPSGEYVPHGAFVVTGKRNWVRGVTLKMAIGTIIGENGKVTFIGGPVDAIRAKTNTYVVLIPGDLSGKDLFTRVLGALARKMPKELQEKVLKSSVEEVREFIPYSKGRISER